MVAVAQTIELSICDMDKIKDQIIEDRNFDVEFKFGDKKFLNVSGTGDFTVTRELVTSHLGYDLYDINHLITSLQFDSIKLWDEKAEDFRPISDFIEASIMNQITTYILD